MDHERHSGKRVLVTGGGSGFGRATALRFAAEGAAHVTVVDRVAERSEAVADELRAVGRSATPLVVDLGTDDGCRAAVDGAVAAMGGLDVAVSNAAAWTQEAFLDMSVESWRRVLSVNLDASFQIGQRSARAMRDAGHGGAILFTSSVSSLGASVEFAHYAVTKAGIANLVTTMAIELAPLGIRVNCVSPGPGDTQQSVDLVGEEQMEKWRRDGFPVVPLGRLAEPDDVAAAFSFLASDEAGYITGVNLVVDGGLTAHAYSIPES